MIGLVAATRRGASLASHLASSWPEARLYEGRPATAVRCAWSTCRQLVLFMATSAAVRLVAPLVARKDADPAVVCVDDGGRYAVALLGAHVGAAALARRVAASLGCEPVVTTASETLGIPALASLGADLGFRVEEGSDLAAVGGALASGEEVRLVEDQRWPLPPLPPNVIRSSELRPPCLLVTDRLVDPPRPAVVYRPPSLVLGVGASRGVGAGEVLALAEEVLAEAGLAARSVACLATVEAKREEEGLLEAAAARGWRVEFHAAEDLARIQVPTPSEAVRQAVGTPSVAEAAVVASGASLLVPKRCARRVTCAVGRRPARGRLALVGLGPGSHDLLTPAARRELARAELVIGLDRYVEQVRSLTRPGAQVEASGIGQEAERARRAVLEAAAGRAVALVSGGDAGVYGMAAPALEQAGGEVEVVVVPGVTAALAAAALLGAPLGHDHCAISLSDLHTPWEVIRRRLEAAAQADFVVTLYNPRSAGRTWQLEEARQILLRHRAPKTPVGVVTDAFRPGQRVEVTTLAALDVSRVGMTTTVVVGSSRTRVVGGRMVTPREAG